MTLDNKINIDSVYGKLQFLFSTRIEIRIPDIHRVYYTDRYDKHNNFMILDNVKWKVDDISIKQLLRNTLLDIVYLNFIK